MIRDFEPRDMEQALAIHHANGLPENCFPNLYIENHEGRTVSNPLFMIKAVCETPDGTPAMMAFVKLQGEIFLLASHDVGTPEERWAWMKDFKEWVAHEAWRNGVEQLTAFIPPEIDASFGKRLEEMGFIRSPYVCWTLNL